MGIAVPDHNASDPRFANRVGAWPGTAAVTAGLEGDREGGALDGTRAVTSTRAIERDDFRVASGGRLGRAAPENAIAPVHHGADRRVWENPTTAAPRRA